MVSGAPMDPGSEPFEQAGEHRGVFIEGRWLVEFETREPAPDHWVAIGFVSEQLPVGGSLPPVMVVGSGQTELAARGNLRRRIAGRSEAPDDEFVMDWALMAVDEIENPS
jgi:hypothetical protein